MRVKFWGTRGSIAKPGPSTIRYGGNTSCVEVRSARGTLVLLDCGTGGHALGRKLMSDGALPLRGSILISHTHWDHIQGIPFFEPLFARGNEWDIYGPAGQRESLREALAGQMRYTYFPITLDQCTAKIRYHDLVEGTFAIDDIEVSARYLNHPALTLGYRLQADGATVVYACDHEPHSPMLATGDGDLSGEDLRHAEFIDGADLLIHDAQYTAEEYPEKVGWGHSPVEYAVRLGQRARVRRVALTHHDPFRDDDAIDRLVASVRQNSSALDVFAACEGQIVEIPLSSTKRPRCRLQAFQAETPINATLARRCALFGVADTSALAALCEAARAEGIRAKSFSSIDEAPTLIAKDRPSLVILEHDLPRINGLDMCRAIRAQANDDDHRPPVIMLAGQDDPDAGAAAGVTDWLIKPFTAACARTKIRTWLLRAACQSIRSDDSAEEERGLAPPPAMQIVDPKPVERLTSSDKSALLWMFGREIAPFDTAAFSRKAGEIIAWGSQERRRSELPVG
jgi:phosphoribosyl 1,2-cyclic phosphodiesterase/CheY-like chemotaxis protein